MRSSFKERLAPAVPAQRTPGAQPGRPRTPSRYTAQRSAAEAPYGVVEEQAGVVAIVCDGPSAAALKDLRFPDGVYVIAVNGAIDWLPEAPDAFFTGDASVLNKPRLKDQRAGTRYYAAAPPGYFKLNRPGDEPVTWLRLSKAAGLSPDKSCIHSINSGYGALGLAYHLGARTIVFFGLDASDNTQRVSGGSSGALNYLPGLFSGALEDLHGVTVINASPESLVRCFPRCTPQEGMAYLSGAAGQKPMMRKPVESVMVLGMSGLGDNLHQRALVRRLMHNAHVWLRTPWPCVYHDLVGQRLSLLKPQTSLRTQLKNAAREQDAYAEESPPPCRQVHVAYRPEDVRKEGSVLAAMQKRAGVPGSQDFRLPIPEGWQAKAQAWLDKWQPGKPLLIYRPLNERTEWGGCAARNPDFGAYAELLRSIRERYFVVSVADFKPGLEWPVGEDIGADVELHAGELDFETLAALTARAAMVYSSPGFAVILAQAVGTPSVCVFGGYEDSHSFAGGATFTPHLGIDPVKPCQCFSHNHDCDKRIDLGAAKRRLLKFAHAPTLGRVRTISQGDLFRQVPRVECRDPKRRYMNPTEPTVLASLVASVAPKAVLEIGINEGYTAADLLRVVPGIERYVGVDVLPGYEPGKALQRREIPAVPGRLAADDPRLEVVLRPRGTFDLTAAELGQFDAVFIDGDHGRAAVANDTALALAVLRPGGIALWHDYNDRPVDVRAVLDEFAVQGLELTRVEGTWLVYLRKSQGS